MSGILSAISLFCEDIREEKNGALTIVGVMSDNVEFNSPEKISSQVPALSKLGIYTRILLPSFYEPTIITVHLKFPDGKEVDFPSFSKEFVESTLNDGRASNKPFSFLVSQAIAIPFVIEQEGRVTVIVRAPAVELISGQLIIRVIYS